MKQFFLFFLFLILFLNFVGAQEPPKYNFGSMQADKELNIIPGSETITKLYFYNIYGNRITHIKLDITEKPENWIITLKPEAMDREVEVSGVKTTVNENLYVESSEALEEKPETSKEGIEYISSSVGYIGANFIEIKIKVPEDEKIGEEFNIKIDAIASWLGQEGTVAIQQGRDFDYKVRTIAEKFYEKVGEAPIKEEKAKITGFFVSEEGKPNKVIGILVSLIIILIGAVAYLVFKKK